jgi:putative NIF3 family GTP cyclohydrolase 1 type 2
MRVSELRRRLTAHFGPDWAPSYVKDIVLAELGGQTIERALELGMEPADIWRAVVRSNPGISSELR